MAQSKRCRVKKTEVKFRVRRSFRILSRLSAPFFVRDHVLPQNTPKAAQHLPTPHRARMFRTCYLWSIGCIIALSPMTIVAGIRTDFSQHKKPATIKVRLADKADGAMLEVKGSYAIFHPVTHLPIASGVLGKRHAVFAHGKGIQWKETFPYIHQMRIVPTDSESTILVNGTEYRGCLEIYNLGGTITLVNEIDIENFLKSTLTLQSIKVPHPALLDAIAIIARTHTYYIASRGAKPHWHVDADEVGYQGYGVTWQNIALERAIEDTRHVVMTHQGQPFAATWTENCAGRTAAYTAIFRKPSPSTQGVASALAAQDREKHMWTFSLPTSRLAQMIGFQQLVQLHPYLDPPSEKIYAMRFSDGVRTRDIDFFALQHMLGADTLLSNDFIAEICGDNTTFHGWGQGHGVGLCLYTANALIARGEKLPKILSTFFPGTQFSDTTGR